MHLHRLKTLVAALALAGAASAANAQYSDGVIKIGVLNDMSAKTVSAKR